MFFAYVMYNEKNKITLMCCMQVHLSQLVGRYMVFNVTFNNILVISWRTVLLVGEI